MAKMDYLLDAAKQIRLALDCEVGEDYQAAFNHYKNGVDLLISGVQVDPNKERREAVKRKTTQYLRRAEEIFNSHLQEGSGSGKATSLCRGYSSLRFRPIRNLSTPVEDLKMCKVIGVIDKVLTVQSLVTKEMFVVKSLPKSSWESREQPTIIPQGVPFMVKLLRYYVSEDTVYLHLGHVQGGRLFSKLQKSRKDRLKEHLECCISTHHKIRLKTSYTSPIISLDCQQGSQGSNALTSVKNGQQDPGDSPDTDSTPSWEETKHQLEDGRTHPYCEETGCLHSARTRLLDSRPVSQDVLLRVEAACGTTLSNTQENTTRTSSEVLDPSTGTTCSVGSSLHLGAACKATNRTEISNPDKLSLNNKGSELVEGNRVPQSDQFSMDSRMSQPDNDNQNISVNLQNSYTTQTVQLPFWKQVRAGEAGEVAFSTEAASFDCDTSKYCGYATGLIPASHLKTVRGREGTTESLGTLQGSGAVPREQEAEVCSGNSQSSNISCWWKDNTQCRTLTGISVDTTCPKDPEVSVGGDQGKGADEEWEMLSPVSKGLPQREPMMEEGWDKHPDAPPCSLYFQSRKAIPDEPAEDQPIEVNGWFLIPRTLAERPREKNMKGSWGLPEEQVCVWGAQILLALESLHQQGILCRDLNPKNILQDSSGNACLTYFGQWSEVQQEVSTKAMEHMYCAPEIGGVSEITEACDWWSLGALLYELLTGMALCQSHPAGVLPHTQLLIPDHLSTAAASLLTELLQFDAGYRLGSGGGGVADIKCHPFFSAVPWHALGS